MLKEIVKNALAQNASDIHLTAGQRPVFRVNGVLAPQNALPVITGADILALAGTENVDLKTELDFSCELEGLCRLRINIYLQGGKPAAALRLIKNEVPALQELGVPPAVAGFTRLRSGLVLVTGPTGSGKSTTLAAMVEAINQSRRAHIITMEDPLEYKFTNAQSIIHQREVGSDTQSFALGLRAALREDPDVILVGELRDAETISIAVTAAETGHLVLATLHTRSAAAALARLTDVFAPTMQQQIRVQLAENLQGIIAQQLVPDVNGGSTAAFEVLVATPAVRSLIRENKACQLASYLQSGRQQGMQCMDFALAELVRRGQITRQTAQQHVFDADLLNKYLAAN